MKRIPSRRRAAWRTLVPIVAATAALAGAVVAEGAQPHRQPVLGSTRFLANANAKGYGEFAPKRIDNDGDPGARVESIAWRHWGRRVVIGTGISSIENPDGPGWIANQHVELRASQLGRCTRGGPRAYRRLEIREPSRPGGRLGPWTSWARDLCRPMP